MTAAFRALGRFLYRPPKSQSAIDSTVNSSTVTGRTCSKQETSVLNHTLLLGIAAASLHVAAYMVYIHDMRCRGTHPNPASWFVWLGLVLFTSFVYNELNGWVRSLQYITGVLGCGFVCIYVVRAGEYKRLSGFEWATVALCLCGMGAWVIGGDAEAAGWIIVAVVCFSSWPTIRDAFSGADMTYAPWLLFAVGFAATAANAALAPYPKPIDIIIPASAILTDTTIVLGIAFARSRAAAHATARRIT